MNSVIKMIILIVVLSQFNLIDCAASRLPNCLSGSPVNSDSAGNEADGKLAGLGLNDSLCSDESGDDHFDRNAVRFSGDDPLAVSDDFLNGSGELCHPANDQGKKRPVDTRSRCRERVYAAVHADQVARSASQERYDAEQKLWVRAKDFLPNDAPLFEEFILDSLVQYARKEQIQGLLAVLAKSGKFGLSSALRAKGSDSTLCLPKYTLDLLGEYIASYASASSEQLTTSHPLLAVSWRNYAQQLQIHESCINAVIDVAVLQSDKRQQAHSKVASRE